MELNAITDNHKNIHRRMEKSHEIAIEMGK